MEESGATAGGGGGAGRTRRPKPVALGLGHPSSATSPLKTSSLHTKLRGIHVETLIFRRGFGLRSTKKDTVLRSPTDEPW